MSRQPHKTRSEAAYVLVGTYRPANEKWIAERRLYNLPLPKCGKLAFHEKISGIVLFAGGHPNLAFKAKFKEVVDGAWLAANGYEREGRALSRPSAGSRVPRDRHPHAAAYALYELLEESTPAKLLGRKSAEVFVSSSRCPCVKIDEIPVDVDVIIGGFPCQDISINGKMQGINGTRSSLYSYIVKAVKRCRPKVFLAENVGSLMLKQHEHSFKTILSDFEALDYNVTYKVYHAEQYGVPQTRERIIFVGTRKDVPEFQPPAPIGNPITCGDALRDLEQREADKAFSHVWSKAAPSGEQGSRKMVENRPGYTIRAECHGNIQFHYKLPRRLSMREAARIQSFPDTFVFPCGIRETERQIGNAVPPVLAWHIAQNIQKALEAK